MDNQHRQIKGYRELTQQEIDLMNEVKALGEQVGKLVEKLQFVYIEGENGGMLDQRWISIGRTDLQTGFMALTRAIAKPENF